MTEREILKNEILNRLGKKLEPFDFTLLKSDTSYIYKNKFGWNKFSLTFLVRDIGWTVRSGALIRFNIVEDLFHQISGFEKKYQKGTQTIGSAIEDLVSEDIQTRFPLTNDNQIVNIVDKLFELFTNVAVPFFQKFNNLNAVDKALNENRDDTSLTGDIFKGTKSLIVGKLLNRSDFSELEKVYQSYYENFADAFYLPEYVKLRELLNNG